MSASPSPSSNELPDFAGGAPPPEASGPCSFEDLKLSAKVLAGVHAAGFEQPTPIQRLFIPKALSGRDVMGQAQTGTGKTAAFLLPIFERIRPGQGNPSVLILAPTRELALQIEGEIKRIGTGLGFSSITLYGGAGYGPQIEALERGVDLVVGTPGRLMDHMRARRLDLSGIRIAVLDEADRMLDLGFRRDIEFILRHCPKSRQTLLLSATIPDAIQKLAQRFMTQPEGVWTSPEKLTLEDVEQFYFTAEPGRKWPALLKVLDTERPKLAIIFCATKVSVRKLARKLKDVFINAREIHGDLVQSKREQIMGRFRKGKVQILVATDVASRGIDVQAISHIINYDVPFKAEDYVHRIGRTGRMNHGGKAITMIEKDDARFLTEIEILINREILPLTFESLESRFWPHPPSAPLPEFAGGDEISAVGEQDYLPTDKKSERHGRSRQPRGKDSAKPQKERRAGDHARESGRRNSRRRGARGAPVEITCARCGAQTSVHFKPDPKRPVYCDTCYRARKAEKTGAGSSGSHPSRFTK